MIRILLATLLLIAASPLRAEDKEKEKPADVQIEVLISDGDKVVERAALHLDLQNGNSFQGKTAIRSLDGGTWTVFVRGYLGGEGERDSSELVMQVNDSRQLQQSIFQGSSSVSSLELFDVSRTWRGPGTYRMAEQGHLVLSLKVADTPALQKKPKVATPEPVGEKQ